MWVGGHLFLTETKNQNACIIVEYAISVSKYLFFETQYGRNLRGEMQHGHDDFM